MIITIAKKEFLEMTRDGRLRWASAVVLMLLVAAFIAGWKSYADAARERGEAKASERGRWLAQGEKNPHSAAHYGAYAFKPKTVLSGIDKGTEAYTGVMVYLEAHRQNAAEYRPASDATLLESFGTLTAATTLQLLVPLLIVLFTFAAFAGEREQGTLRQLLSLGVSRPVLAVGKASGVGAALMLLLAPAAIIGSAALMLAGNVESLAGNDDAQSFSAARLGIMTGFYVLYFAAWVMAGLAVSAFASSSRLALAVLLSVWFAQSFIAPRVAADLAASRDPAPALANFRAAIRTDVQGGIDGHNPTDKRREALMKKVLAEYRVDSVAALPVNFDAIAMQQGEEYGNTVYDKHFGNLFAAYERQNYFYQWAGLVAPVLSMQSLSMGLAGTDVRSHGHFTDAAEGYRRTLVKLMNNDMAAHSKTGDWDYKASGALWKQVPPFSYSAPDAAWVMSGYRASAAVLLLWTAISAGLLMLAVRMVKI